MRFQQSVHVHLLEENTHSMEQLMLALARHQVRQGTWGSKPVHWPTHKDHGSDIDKVPNHKRGVDCLISRVNKVMWIYPTRELMSSWTWLTWLSWQAWQASQVCNEFNPTCQQHYSWGPSIIIVIYFTYTRSDNWWDATKGHVPFRNQLKLVSWTWQISFNWVEMSLPTWLDLTNLPATLFQGCKDESYK